MLHLCCGIANINIGKRVGAAFIADEHGVALGIISCIVGIFHNLDSTAVSLLTLPGRNAFRNNGAFGVFADVYHFSPSVGLLKIIGQGNGIKFAYRIITFQYTGWIFPCDG